MDAREQEKRERGAAAYASRFAREMAGMRTPYQCCVCGAPTAFRYQQAIPGEEPDERQAKPYCPPCLARLGCGLPR